MSSWTTLTIETEAPGRLKEEVMCMAEDRFADCWDLSHPDIEIRSDVVTRANMDVCVSVFRIGGFHDVYCDFLRQASAEVKSVYVLSISDFNHRGTIKRYGEKEFLNQTGAAEVAEEFPIEYCVRDDHSRDLGGMGDEVEYWLQCDGDSGMWQSYDDIRGFFWDRYDNYPLIGGNWVCNDVQFDPR